MFRTELPLTPHPSQLPLAARVLTIGSCFSDTIGRRLAQHKVSTLVNPFGTVFNPLSACLLLRAAAGEEQDWQQHLVEARGRWQSYDLPAEIGADSPVALLQQIREVVQQTGEFLATADVVVLTLGTAFAYRLLETDELVSNCHKIPADKFEKELLTPDEIINAVAETHAYLRLQNPKLRIILTVSPVRHLKDTLPLNAVSKSVLRVACHYLSELLPDVSYFPAYELLLDDLRDYRFYAADMLHPSEVAENYIWERFTRTYFDQAFGRFKKEWEAVRQALGHRPLYAAAPEHRTFLEGTLTRLQTLAAQVDVSAEIRGLEQELAALPVPTQPVPEPEFDDDEERIDIGEGSETSVPAATTLAEAAAAPAATDDSRRDQNRNRGRNDRQSRQGRSEREPRLETPPVVEETPAAAALPAPATVEPVAVEVAATPISAGGEEAPVLPKKKRRSRGGAKRTARKNAAKAALEAAQQAAGSVTQAVTVEPLEPTAPAAVAPASVAPAPVPAVAAAAPKPEPAPTPEQPPVTATPPPATPALPAAPRSVPAYQKPAPKGDWLVPMKDGDVPLPKRPTKGIVRTPPTRKNTKSTIVTPPKSAAKAEAKLEPTAAVTAIPVATAPAPAVVATAPVEPVVTPALPAALVAPAVPKASAPKRKAAPKKAAAPVVVPAAPVVTAAEAPVPKAAKAPAKAKATKAAPKAPAKAIAAASPAPAQSEAALANPPEAAPSEAVQPAPRKPAARKAAPKAVAAPAPTEAAAAPKRVRPPRKKPAQPGGEA